MKKCPLASIFITVLSVVLMAPAFVSAQSNDYWRQQQQQQMQQEQQRRWQQQQDDMRRQAAERERQRQIEIERQRQVERQRQEQLRQQKAEEARRQQLEQQQKRQAEQARRQQPAQQQAQQRQQIMKAPRNPTPGEIQKGFTGRVTADGRALVKFQNRILTVPAARISGLSAKLANDNQRKSNWTAQKQSAINSRIKAVTSGGVLEGANFAQKTFNPMFSKDGVFAGKSVDDVASALRSGVMKPSEVPIDYIVRDGNKLILNTRSAQALEAAGIHRSQWNAVNRTGQEMYENMLSGQLQRNNLTSEGISTVRRSGER